MQHKILILFAHPVFEKSAVNKTLTNYIPGSPDLTFHDLYEAYPEFNIDVEHEKKLLERHDLIIWHHPVYWYSCPPLLKQWIDLVLEFGWAYGPGGVALAGKKLMQVITTGGGRAAYQREGFHQHTLLDFLAPMVQTARLCKMDYLPPFVVHGTHRVAEAEIHHLGRAYESLLRAFLEHNFDFEALRKYDYANDWLDNLNVPHHG